MRALALAVGVAASLLSAPAMAGDWRAVDFTEDFTAGIDLSGIREARPGVKRVWSVKAYVTTQEDGEDYSLTRYEFDCNNETSETLSLVLYRENGSVVNAVNGNGTTRQITPDTIIEATFNATCSAATNGQKSFGTAQSLFEAARQGMRQSRARR